MRLAAMGALVICLGISPAPLDEFIWNDAGPAHRWDDGCNWGGDPGECAPGSLPYPDDPGDNATIPYDGLNEWTVDLAYRHIGELTIKGNVEFRRPGARLRVPAPILRVDRLTIDAASGPVTVRMNQAHIVIP
jgi:hypothetical protein